VRTLPRVWPKQQWLVNDLRDVLRGAFGCQDAWVVAGDGRFRLEVRVGGRQITLLADDEERFWARFYTPMQRNRLHLGEQGTQTVLWRKSKHELADVLSGPWMERVGPPPARAASPAARRLPRA
jgi:hypothetical protein